MNEQLDTDDQPDEPGVRPPGDEPAPPAPEGVFDEVGARADDPTGETEPVVLPPPTREEEVVQVPPFPPPPPPSPPRADDSYEEGATGPKPARTLRSAIVGGLVGAVVGAIVASGIVLAVDDDEDGRTVASDTVAAGRSDLRESGDPLTISALLERVEPSVVQIETGVPIRGQQGAGSGVILSADGLVLTNSHVVQGVTSIEVRAFDGRTHEADLVGSSPDDDIALVRIRDADGLEPATLGSSEALRVGDEVVAIGNALALGETPTVTRGIVSAKDRTIQAGGDVTLDNMIQTDAAINRGNSGGPLVNAAGEVVGINTAVAGDSAQNIGFAIAIDSVRPLIERLEEGGGEIRGGTFLGVSTVALDDVREEVLEEFGVEADDGAFVSEVVPGTAAEDAGLQLGDVIISVDGENVSSPEGLGRIIRGLEPGDEVTIEWEREGETTSEEVELGSRGVA